MTPRLEPVVHTSRPTGEDSSGPGRTLLRQTEERGIMGVDEARRLSLYSAARRTLGDREAATLMELVTPSGVELATRADLHALETGLEGRLRGFVLSTVLTVAMAQVALTVSLIVLLQR
ncbi:MAG: hypothetical protein WD041_04095 [Nitriliruptoraceae bacterium]